MNERKSKESGIDDLVRRTLKDDLPDHAAVRMRAHLERFRRRESKAGQPEAAVAMGVGRGPLFFRKPLLTAASLMLIALGGYWQISGFRSPLTENLALLGSYRQISSRAVEAAVMTCRLRLTLPHGESRSYIIRWQTPDILEIELMEKGRLLMKNSIRLPEERLSLAGSTLFPPRQDPERFLEDPRFRPISDFLSPARLMRGLAGRWRERPADHETGIVYAVSFDGGKNELLVTLDPVSRLPRNIRGHGLSLAPSSRERAETWEADLEWNVIRRTP